MPTFKAKRLRCRHWLCGSQVILAEMVRGCLMVRIRGEVIYQHDDETSLALVEAMQYLAGKETWSLAGECSFALWKGWGTLVPQNHSQIHLLQDGICLMAYEFRDGLMQERWMHLPPSGCRFLMSSWPGRYPIGHVWQYICIYIFAYIYIIYPYHTSISYIQFSSFHSVWFTCSLGSNSSTIFPD